MPNLSLSVRVTRALLSLGDLGLQDPTNGYEVISGGPGTVGWRLTTVQSQYVHGNTLVSAVKDVSIAPLKIRVKASSHGTLDSRLDTLLDAFSQFSYFLGWTIEGVTEKLWLCQPANYSVSSDGAELSKFHLMAKQYEVSLEIPRHPQPITGSI